MSELLSVEEHEGQICDSVLKNRVTVLAGDTGSGKSTRIPPMLDKLGFEGTIGISEPRRLAAVSLAKFVKEKMGLLRGGRVGYKVRFDDSTNYHTRLKFMTDGILLREATRDPLFGNYSVVMVDEAHERSINIDVSLYLLKRALTKRRDLKVVVTSATLDTAKFCNYFGVDDALEIPGRSFPIETVWGNYTVPYPYDGKLEEFAEEIVNVVRMIEGGPPGDVLIFLTGKEDIDFTVARIGKEIKGVTAMPLYGAMSLADQERVFKPCRGRKVVVATNIAETSITINGIVYVVDPGYIKEDGYDAELGMGSLRVVPHSRSGCDQRKGRAGRTRPGICLRLFTKEDYSKRQEFTLPQIQRKDLAETVLFMKSLGLNVDWSDFIDPPSAEAIKDATSTLWALGALDTTEKITKIGTSMSSLPVPPREARMVVEGIKRGCTLEVLALAALFSVRNPFMYSSERDYEIYLAHEKFRDPTSDFQSLLNMWRAWRKNIDSWEWCNENFLHWRNLNEANKIYEQLLVSAEEDGIELTSSTKKDEITKSVLAGFISNLCRKSGRGYLRGETRVSLHPSSMISNTPEEQSCLFVVCREIVTTSRNFARVAAVIKPEWLKEIAPAIYEKEFGTQTGAVPSGAVPSYPPGRLDRLALYKKPPYSRRRW